VQGLELAGHLAFVADHGDIRRALGVFEIEQAAVIRQLPRLILDSRVVMGQFWRNRLFLQAFHGGRDRGGIFGKAF